jgi:hypothetical protein
VATRPSHEPLPEQNAKKQTRRQKIDAKRFYTSQWDDLWSYVLDNPGSVIDGNDGHNYLMVSPSWNGTVTAVSLVWCRASPTCWALLPAHN